MRVALQEGSSTRERLTHQSLLQLTQVYKILYALPLTLRPARVELTGLLLTER